MKLHARLYGIGSAEYIGLRNYLRRFSKDNNIGLTLDEISDVDQLIKNKIDRIPALELNGRIFWSENRNELLNYLRQFILNQSKA